jgi:hypothetical protein
MKIGSLFLVAALSAVTAIPARAQNNEPPPAGAILDLNGTPIPGGGNGSTFQTYTVDFTGVLTNTAITFAFRDDPAFEIFENASVVNLTTSSGNLLTNGNFSGAVGTGVFAGIPIGWQYAVYGAAIGGGAVRGPGVGGTCPTTGTTRCWDDGTVQAYDAISQTISTTVGDLYQISFSLAENSDCSAFGGPPCDFQDLSTNGVVTYAAPGTGGNGIDVLAYAQAGLPAPGNIPEPGTLVLFGTGMIGVAGTLRRKLIRK